MLSLACSLCLLLSLIKTRILHQYSCRCWFVLCNSFWKALTKSPSIASRQLVHLLWILSTWSPFLSCTIGTAKILLFRIFYYLWKKNLDFSAFPFHSLSQPSSFLLHVQQTLSHIILKLFLSSLGLLYSILLTLKDKRAFSRAASHFQDSSLGKCTQLYTLKWSAWEGTFYKADVVLHPPLHTFFFFAFQRGGVYACSAEFVSYNILLVTWFKWSPFSLSWLGHSPFKKIQWGYSEKEQCLKFRRVHKVSRPWNFFKRRS